MMNAVAIILSVASVTSIGFAFIPEPSQYELDFQAECASMGGEEKDLSCFITEDGQRINISEHVRKAVE